MTALPALEGSVQRQVIGEIVEGERWVLDSSYGAWPGGRSWA